MVLRRQRPVRWSQLLVRQVAWWFRPRGLAIVARQRVSRWCSRLRDREKEERWWPRCREGMPRSRLWCGIVSEPLCHGGLSRVEKIWRVESREGESFGYFSQVLGVGLDVP
ncbi:hypothetical protein L3X38_037120 [Prunus dulcis]|uniref:Uncharacterized protein n=1 Tax=Prunus dulcis TaxID=3755 RepID=A0AAD4V3X3_PRUDU|nr:hypothetical protein L3X38_037120 [Prunus dulcis]